LRERQKEAAYERMRVRLANDIRSLMEEDGITFAALAERLGFTESETRQQVLSNDLRLSQLVGLLDALNLEPYILFRPRKAWITE